MEPNNLKVIRDFWAVPAVTMSRLCGFGVNQWRDYEAGKAEPNKSNGILIHMVANPYVFRALLKVLPEDERLRMGKRYDKLILKADSVCKTIDQKAEQAKQNMAMNWCR